MPPAVIMGNIGVSPIAATAITGLDLTMDPTNVFSTSQQVIQELLGHATIMMTMRYAHLAPEIARDAVRLLDGLADRRKTVANSRKFS